MIIYGGINESHPNTKEGVKWMINEKRWERLHMNMEVNRRKLIFEQWETKGVIVGGEGNNMGTIEIYDCQQNTLTTKITTGRQPHQIVEAVGVIYQDHLFVFGGRYNQTIYKLNLITKRWRETPQQLYQPLAEMAIIQMEPSIIGLFGGRTAALAQTNNMIHLTIDCQCPQGYYGEQCDDYDCYGLHTNDTQTCSQHGQCEAPNYCQCQTSYQSTSNCQKFDNQTACREKVTEKKRPQTGYASAAAAARYNDTLYFIGGEYEGTSVSQILMYQMNTDTWMDIQDGPIALHGSAYAYHQKHIYIYSGQLGSGELYDGLCVFTLPDLAWNEVDLDRQGILPRMNTAFFVKEDTLYISMGRGETTGNRFNEFIELSLLNYTLKSYTVNQDHYGHSMIAYNSTLAIVYGGKTVSAKDHLYFYDYSSHTNRLINSPRGNHDARYHHSAILYRHIMYLIGGVGKTDLLKLDCEEIVFLEKQSILEEEHFNDAIVPFDNRGVFLFGGRNGSTFAVDRLTFLLLDDCSCQMGYLEETCLTPQCDYDNTTCYGHGTCLAPNQCDCQPNYDDHAYCQSNDILMQCTDDLEEVIHVGAVKPQNTKGSILMIYENNLFLLSGRTSTSSFTDKVYSMDLPSKKWTLQPSFLSGEYYSYGLYKDALFIYGGLLGVTYSNNLYVYNLRTLELQHVNYGSSFVSRAEAGFTTVDESLYIVGGLSSPSSHHNTVIRLNMETLEIGIVGTFFTQGVKGSFVTHYKEQLMIFGGAKDATYYDQTLKYFYQNATYEAQLVLGTKPSARYTGGVVQYKEFMVIIGGVGAGGVAKDDVHKLNCETLQWTQLSTTLPVAVYGINSQLYKGRYIYYYGGSNVNQPYDDLYQIDLTNCTCHNGYTGFNCTQFFCYSHDSRNADVCSGHGVCVTTNNCTCQTNYSGHNCSEYACFGISRADNLVCSGHGYCIDLDHCQCDPGYGGMNCSDISCYGIVQQSNLVCSTHGSCSSPNNCSCEENYSGADCSTFTCFGYPSTIGTVCSGHGTCGSFNNCSCSAEYFGLKCNNFTCFGLNPLNETVCSSHGQCVAPNECTCDTNYAGLSCSNFSCFQLDHHHESVCSAHGQCVSADNCVCEPNYSDNDCSFFSCFNRTMNDSTSCSSHGQCVGHNVCSCEPHYSLSNCSLYDCYDIQYDDPSVCSAHGSCVSFRNCSCFEGYSGPTCTTFTCFGISPHNTSVCSAHGSCDQSDHCRCVDNYYGPTCSIYTCFGVLSKDFNVCYGHGSCIANDTCACIEDYRVDLSCACRAGFDLQQSQCVRTQQPILFTTSSSYTFYTDQENSVNINYVYPLREAAVFRWEISSAPSSGYTFLMTSEDSLNPSITFPSLSLSPSRIYSITLSLRDASTLSLITQRTFIVHPRQRIAFGGSLNSAEVAPLCPFYNFTFSDYQLEEKPSSILDYSLEFSTEYSPSLFCPLRDPSFVQFLPNTFGDILVKGSVINSDDPSAVHSELVPVYSIPPGVCDVSSSFVEEAKDAFQNLQTQTLPCDLQLSIIRYLNDSSVTQSSIQHLISNLTNSCQGFLAFHNFLKLQPSNVTMDLFPFLVSSYLSFNVSSCAALDVCTKFQMISFLFSLLDSSLSLNDPSFGPSFPSHLAQLLSISQSSLHSCSFRLSYLSLSFLSNDTMIFQMTPSLYPHLSYFSSLLHLNDSFSLESPLVFLPPHSNASSVTFPSSLRRSTPLSCFLFNFDVSSYSSCSYIGSRCSCSSSSSLSVLFLSTTPSSTTSSVPSSYFFFFFLFLLIPLCCCCCSLVLLFIFIMVLFRLRKRSACNPDLILSKKNSDGELVVSSSDFYDFEFPNRRS